MAGAGDMLAAAMPPNAGASGVMKPPMAPAPAEAPKAPSDGTVTVPKSSIPTEVVEGDEVVFKVVSSDGENVVLTYATPEEVPEETGKGSDKMPKGGLAKAFSEAEQTVGK